MSMTVGFFALLEAKPDKAGELAAFLEDESQKLTVMVGALPLGH